MIGLTDKEIFNKYFILKEVNKLYHIVEKETMASVFKAKSKPIIKVKAEAIVSFSIIW